MEDVGSLLREVKQKMAVMGKVLLEHEGKISELEGRRGEGNKQNERENGQLSVKGSFQQHKTFKDRIFLQIDKLRQQIKKSSSSSKSSFQLPRSPKFLSYQQSLTLVQSQLTLKIKQLKQKTYNHLKLMNESFRKELQHQIHNTQDINKVVFNRIEKDMIELEKKIGGREKIEEQRGRERERTGRERYLGVLQMIKFKEIVERNIYGKDKQKQQSFEQVVINQGTYFLDNDGYLLDKQGYYITGDDDKWIQLSPKQIKILKAYNILQE